MKNILINILSIVEMLTLAVGMVGLPLLVMHTIYLFRRDDFFRVKFKDEIFLKWVVGFLIIAIISTCIIGLLGALEAIVKLNRGKALIEISKIL